MNTDITKQFEQFAEMMKAAMPKVTHSKNGYEIRTKVLEFAQTQAWQDYNAKWGQFETTISKNGDQIVTKVDFPTVPGSDTVLETAQKFYDFVCGTQNKKVD
jgi:hypothetical protein